MKFIIALNGVDINFIRLKYLTFIITPLSSKHVGV